MFPLGCGKTTTMNMRKRKYIYVQSQYFFIHLLLNSIYLVTGLFTPSSGNAFVMGFDIATEVPEIQSIIGICPQFDILWGELSATEHLNLYGRFKGLTLREMALETAQKLKQFDLHRDAHKPVVTFSGGMKRRLSVALASVGDPKFILLDEPTTVSCLFINK